jgi:hypothetical protein
MYEPTWWRSAAASPGYAQLCGPPELGLPTAVLEAGADEASAGQYVAHQLSGRHLS